MITVDFIKVRLSLFLVAEDLDDLLSLHHFLDKPFRLCDGALCGKEILARPAADQLCHEDDHADPEKNNDSKINTERQHDHKERDAHDAGNKKLRNGLCDHLTQRIDIVRIITHDIAVVVRIEVTDGQILHPVEHLLAHTPQVPLRDDRHELVVGRARDERDRIHPDQDADLLRDVARDRVPGRACRDAFEIVEEREHNEGGQRRDDRVDDDAHERDGQHPRIVVEERLDEPFDDPLLQRRPLLHLLLFHCCSPPSFSSSLAASDAERLSRKAASLAESCSLSPLPLTCE